MEISNHSTYGAKHFIKPIFMSGKETVAFLKRGKTEEKYDTSGKYLYLGSNRSTYMEQHTTYEVSDKKKEVRFWIWIFLIKDETSSLRNQ
ncbi:hypothetical protein [Roseburia intestinalis]